MLGPLSLDGEREDERPLLHELLRCRRLSPPRDSLFFLSDAWRWRPGEAEGLRWWPCPRARWCRLDEWPPLVLVEDKGGDGKGTLEVMTDYL